MKINDPFGPGGPYHDFFRQERERAEMFRKMLGPAHDLKRLLDEQRGPPAQFAEMQRGGTLSTLFKGADLHAENTQRLQALTNPAWVQALQGPAFGIGRDELGILKTQRLIAGALDSDVLKLARTLEDHRSVVQGLMAATSWADRFRSLTEQLAPNLAGIKAAAENARLLDMMTLRASADAVSRTAVVIAAEQVLEAHRLIEAIGHAESPEQGATLFAALLTVVAALFARFGENTMNELRKIGAVTLVGLLAGLLGLLPLVTTPDMSPTEKKVVAEMQAEVTTLKDKLETMQAADVAASEAYVSALPRAELRRAAPIRREASAGAGMLLRGPPGMLLAVKESRPRWRRVVYRDPLTDQLAEGWVNAGAVHLLDDAGK